MQRVDHRITEIPWTSLGKYYCCCGTRRMINCQSVGQTWRSSGIRGRSRVKLIKRPFCSSPICRTPSRPCPRTLLRHRRQRTVWHKPRYFCSCKRPSRRSTTLSHPHRTACSPASRPPLFHRPAPPAGEYLRGTSQSCPGPSASFASNRARTSYPLDFPWTSTRPERTGPGINRGRERIWELSTARWNSVRTGFTTTSIFASLKSK